MVPLSFMKKKANIQSKFRKENFNFHQYWNLNYTEKYSDGTEKDFKTFIKAKSYAFAKEILIKRLREDDPKLKIKAVHGFMFHKDYHLTCNRKLKLKDWERIRTAAFPNVSNSLFKLEIARDPNKTNRFNETDYERIKTIGFKSGKDNWSVKNVKGKVLDLDKRSHMIYKGKWMKWDKDCRDNTKREIIDALISNDNIRQKAAESLKWSRNRLYTLMSRFPEIDWNEEYPPPKPFENARKPDPQVLSRATQKSMKKRMSNGFTPFALTPEQEKKRKAGREKHCEKLRAQREVRFQSQIKLIKEALRNNNNKRNKAAKSLGWKMSYLSKIMTKTRHLVDWKTEFPNNNIRKDFLND